ncbi:MAG: CtsR family transcriptional regulator [Eubacteriales bacterium]|nr:CtsR family transcriptional regulator [Eubacteriales bacterium]
MSVLSDHIEAFIKASMGDLPQVELCRQALAAQFHCAPSQINYVLATRFAPDLGYVIQSKRGGGGYIRILRINIDKEAYLMALISQGIGEAIRESQARALIDRLYEREVIQGQEARLMRAAVADQTLKAACHEKDILRAAVLKSMLLALAGGAEVEV